ncbi:MAG: UDP-N-acetylmuramoyl-L-alanine--D-glutamate ligase [Xanthomonadales bacterium]|nr:UDP-N-acetylmuramoyl-L-alanine--D-glutamate ligase [Xanthomonadales bacterium]
MNFERVGRRRTAIWGFGAEGQAALRVLRRLFPEKPVDLILTEAEAAAWDFGGDPFLTVQTDDPSSGLLAQYQVVIKSPGISAYHPAIEWANFRGSRIVSGTHLWFDEHAEDRTIAITGTKGKSTVSALVAHLLRAGGHRTALAGNIGMPLLELFDPDPAPEVWVIELSSFQTADLGEGVPTVATILNLSPEHLDWHGTAEQYYEDKLAILCDNEVEVAVINAADAELMRRTASVPSRVLFNHGAGWHVSGDWIMDGSVQVLPLSDLPLPGAHNASNVCAALATVEAAGMDARALARHVRSFRALPHRLQPLGEKAGIRYINDSIATTPAAMIEAVRAVAPSGPLALLIGGKDRGLDWRPHAAELAQLAPTVIVGMGEFGKRLVALLAEQGIPPERLAHGEDLAQAMAMATARLPDGGTVLLSPGAPSFDAFRDYRERGERFAELAGFDPALIGRIEGLGIA